jgi:hypothetical protein
MYCPSIHLKGLKKIIKNLSQSSCPPSQESKRGPPIYEVDVVVATPRCSVKFGKLRGIITLCKMSGLPLQG